MARTKTPESGTTVRGLGEIALRVNNLDTMQKFYEEVIGLPLMTRVPNCAFFKIAEGYGGPVSDGGTRDSRNGTVVRAVRRSKN
ncbi:MAG TPA: hypothetical protein VEV41_10680, partial [Terriglobales bacterium]|nr:hypothetical protein [Terriglobales bacterium]